jgi:hypothetical protein
MSTNAIKTLLEKQLHAYQGFLSGQQCDLSAFCESCAEKATDSNGRMVEFGNKSIFIRHLMCRKYRYINVRN